MRGSTLLLALLLTPVLAACGGSGAGPSGPPLDPFHGSYHFFQVTGESGPDALAIIFGTADVVDGGTTALHVRVHRLGAVTPPIDAAGVLESTVTASGRWELGDPTDPDTRPSLAGGRTPDGRIAFAATVREDTVPAFQLYLRRSGTHSLASLQGLYLQSAFGEQHALGHVFGMGGVMEFDAGTWERRVAYNGGGSLLGVPAVETGTVTVATDGTVTLANIGPPLIGQSGGVLDGGSVAAVAGGTITDNPADFEVYTHPLTAGSNGLLNGTYRVIGMERLVATSGYAVYEGSLTSDGAGNYSIEVIRNDGTTVSLPTTDTGTYGVSLVGQFILNTSGGVTMTGGITSDGTFAILGGPATDLTNPRIWMLVKP